MVIPVFLSIFLGLKAILLNLAFMMITAGVLWFYKRKMNCVTGDMLGAMVEILEAGLFLLASIRLF